MIYLRKLLFLLLCFVIYTSTSLANETYVKLNYGIATFDQQTSTFNGTNPTFDDTSEGYMFSAGQRIGSNWGVDFLYYDLGSTTIKGSKLDVFKIDGAAYQFSTGGTITNDITGYGLGGIGFADIGDLSSVYAKLGVHVWDKSGSTTLLTDTNDTFKGKFYNDGTDLYFGLGFDINIIEGFAISAAYDGLGFSDEAGLSSLTTYLSLGIKASF